LASPITKVDTVGIPSQDAERSRRFYLETLELRPDEHARYEFWAGDTCFAARAELEAKGVEFEGETFDSGVCHMATFLDPDGNRLLLHRRYASYS
jgi:catechol 2,3-dioxygenase-like lactoylglutathione lyase family enzyme